MFFILNEQGLRVNSNRIRCYSKIYRRKYYIFGKKTWYVRVWFDRGRMDIPIDASVSIEAEKRLLNIDAAAIHSQHQARGIVVQQKSQTGRNKGIIRPFHGGPN